MIEKFVSLSAFKKTSDAASDKFIMIGQRIHTNIVKIGNRWSRFKQNNKHNNHAIQVLFIPTRPTPEKRNSKFKKQKEIERQTKKNMKQYISQMFIFSNVCIGMNNAVNFICSNSSSIVSTTISIFHVKSFIFLVLFSLDKFC